jgi:hypothetical protein
VRKIYLVIGSVLALWGLCLFGLRVFYWLKSGGWPSIQVGNLFAHADHGSRLIRIEPYDLVPGLLVNSWPWLQHPREWIGVHKVVSFVVEFVPLALALIFGGFALVDAGGRGSKNGRRPVHATKGHSAGRRD